MKFCNGTTRQQSFGVAWGTCPPDSLGFFAFLLLQQKGWRPERLFIKDRPGPSAVCRLQSTLGSLPSVALSSAGASGIGPYNRV
jgi:hypothetical protein